MPPDTVPPSPARGGFASARRRGQIHGVRISVIIPAFNEEKLLASTLRHVHAACAAFHAQGWATELIVCDNNSTDRTADLARAGGATVVFEPVNQIARARNHGAVAAAGDWLVFVDADSSPSPELFADVAERIRGGGCLAGGATVRLDNPGRLARWTCGLWNWISRSRNLMAGSFIFCEAAAFREVGGFDENLFASEELALSRQLKTLARRRGREVVILHRHPLLTSDRKARLYTMGEHLRFLTRLLLGMGRPLRSREACFTWYDGRR